MVKPKVDAPDLDVRISGRGSIDKNGMFGASWSLVRSADGSQVRFRGSDKEAAKRFELWLRFPEEEGVYSVEVCEASVQKWDPVVGKIEELVEQEGLISIPMVMKSLKLLKDTARDKVTGMVNKGILYEAKAAVSNQPAWYGLVADEEDEMVSP